MLTPSSAVDPPPDALAPDAMLDDVCYGCDTGRREVTVETITHREMRNNSAEVLRRVAAGESFVVTNNGEEVAVLSPRGKPSSHLERLIADGVVTPAANRGVYRAEPQHYDGPPSGEVIAADRARR